MDLTVNQWLAGFDPQMRSQICRSSSLGGQRIVYPTKVGSIPIYGAKSCPVLSMDRIPCYERGDGGSIPSLGANYWGQ